MEQETALSLFDEQELSGIQPTGSTWIVNDNDPATLPVPLPIVIRNVKGPYTARDRKLWNVLVHSVFDELGKQGGHAVKISDINNLFRSVGGQHETAWIWESAKRLSQTNIEFEMTFNDTRYDLVTNILNAAVPRKGKRGNELYFWIPEPLVPILKEPLRFTRLRIHFLIKLSGKYAVTLYEILESYANRRDGECAVSIDELRTWLKVKPESYKTWKDFRKWVLDPAIKQINDDPLGAGFSVEYEPIRKGRFYNEVIFRLKKTDDRRKIERSIKNAGSPAVSIIIPRWADEKGREEAHKKGWDYAVLRENWLGFARSETAKGNPPKDAGAAFVAYCKKQDSLR